MADVRGPPPERTTSSVVVPASNDPSAVACLRSLKSAGLHTIAASVGESGVTSSSTCCDEVIAVPDPREKPLEYKDSLVTIASRVDVRTIVPIFEEDIYLFARYHDEFERYVSLVVPPLDILEQVHDRLQLAKAATEAGVPVPETRLLRDGTGYSEGAVVKSRYNLLTDAYLDLRHPGEITTINTIEHVAPEADPAVDALYEAMDHVPIIQEFIPGEDEYMVATLCDHGDPVALFQHRQVRGTKYVGSGGAYRESVSIPELEEVATTLLDHLDWHGLACLEYVEDENTGEFKLIEINPRMWQSLASTVRMGADFPLYYWYHANGSPDEIDPEYDVGIGCHWLKGELRHVLSLFRENSPLVERPSLLATVGAIVWSCTANPRFDYLRLDDPGPFVQDWLNELAGVSALPRVQIGHDKETELSGHDPLEDSQETGDGQGIREQCSEHELANHRT